MSVIAGDARLLRIPRPITVEMPPLSVREVAHRPGAGVNRQQAKSLLLLHARLNAGRTEQTTVIGESLFALAAVRLGEWRVRHMFASATERDEVPSCGHQCGDGSGLQPFDVPGKGSRDAVDIACGSDAMAGDYSYDDGWLANEEDTGGDGGSDDDGDGGELPDGGDDMADSCSEANDWVLYNYWGNGRFVDCDSVDSYITEAASEGFALDALWANLPEETRTMLGEDLYKSAKKSSQTKVNNLSLWKSCNCGTTQT